MPKGKWLEEFVAFVEERLVPQGFSVTPNHRVFNENGVQIAELDVLVRGTRDGRPFSWLMQCRDRPGKRNRSAPGEWILELVGRKQEFKYDKVTAISRTGFSPGAIRFARNGDIELRTVRSLEAAELTWLAAEFTFEEHMAELQQCNLTLDSAISTEQGSLVFDLLKSSGQVRPLVRVEKSGEVLSLHQLFTWRARQLYDRLDPATGPRQYVTSFGRHPEMGDFFIDTSAGAVRILKAELIGWVQVLARVSDMQTLVDYGNLSSGASISQAAEFHGVGQAGEKITLQVHRVHGSNALHFAMKSDAESAGTMNPPVDPTRYK